jgi:hypothetical protein
MTDQTLETLTTDRTAELAQYGIAPDHVQHVQLQLDVLRRQGVLVDLAIGGVGMFTRAATWEELGFTDDDLRRSRLTRGQKYLIPEEQVKRLRSIESQMRQCLEGRSYRITGFSPYRWIPFTAYETFVSEWQELLARFAEARRDILNHYEEYVDLLADDFRQVAENAWRSMQNGQVVEINGVRYTDLDRYTDRVVQCALARFPSRREIEDGLTADYTTALVYAEQDLAADQLAASRIYQQAEIERAETDARKREAYLQAHLLESEIQRQVTMRSLEEQEKRIKIEAMLQAEAEHARQRLQAMASPFDEVFVQLRKQIAADCQSMLESIHKNGYVRGKVAEKGRGLIEFFELMAAHDDGKLRDRLLELKSAIGPVGDERRTDAPDRDVAEITGLLSQVIDLGHAAAQDLVAGPSRFSMLEV